MYATPLTLNHTPVSMVQKGGSGGGIDMIGEQGLLNKNPVPPYNSETPKTE